VSTLFKASLQPRRLWVRVLKRVYPDLAVDERDRRRVEANDAYAKRDDVLLRAVSTPKAPQPGPSKTWGKPQTATPISSTYQPPLAPPQPPVVGRPQAFGILWAACAVLCLLLYGILAALKEIVGRTTCLSFLVLLTAALLWLIVKNSKLSSTRRSRWVAAAASAMTLMAICLLTTNRANPLHLSAQALAASTEVKGSDYLGWMNAHPSQTKIQPTETIVTLPRGESPASQLTAYIEAVKTSVAQKWNVAEVAAGTAPGATVYIQFDVRRRGNHEVPTVETSSGSSSLDSSCLRAISRAQAFGHFPRSYTGDSLTVLYHCTYPGSPGIKLAQDSIQPPVSEIPGISDVQPPTQ
jgi:TonB C terminal